VRSDAQAEQATRGKAFARELANLGGEGGIEGALGGIEGANELLGKAVSGDREAQDRLIYLMKQVKRKDTSGLERARDGLDSGIGRELTDAGRENQEIMFAEQAAQAEADEKLRLELNQAGRDNTVEGQKEANDKLVAELNKAGAEFEAMGQADAAEGRRADAENEALADFWRDKQELAESVQIREMDRMMNSNMFAGPRTMGSADFGASVESSMEHPMRKGYEVWKEQRDLAKRHLEIAERLEQSLGRVR
jgi:hypothetical protein